MKVITRQSRANRAYAKWMTQYPSDKNGIGAKLKALGSTPDPDAVDSIIGNKSWTELYRCSECGVRSEVVELGEALDYESSTAWICVLCLKDAVAIAEAKCGK